MREKQTIYQGGEEIPPYGFVFESGSLRPENPDIKKALVELKRDALLEQYQFFVGAQERIAL